MATAKKLPSGSWRCQIFAGYDFIDGKKKRRYESFTAPTKKEAELKAVLWANVHAARPSVDLTVSDMVQNYIKYREPVLSPATIRGYHICFKRFDPIADMRVRDLTTENVQMWISMMASIHSPKTVSNTYGLLTASMDFSGFNSHFRVKLPAKQKKQYHLPTDQDIQTLLRNTEGTSLWIAIMLARYYSLRRSEICALTSDDLEGNVLSIRRSIVKDHEKNWITKEMPKTYGSYRYLVLSDPLLSVLKSRNGRFLNCNPDTLASYLRAAQRKYHIEPFGFHMLRHLFATKNALLGIPDIYTAKMGGWEQGSSVLKRIYQNVQDNDFRDQMSIVNAAMQHEMQHEK